MSDEAVAPTVRPAQQNQVVQLIRAVDGASTATIRHAIIVYFLVARHFHIDVPVYIQAHACFLYALKERNESCIPSSISDNEDPDLVGMELFLLQQVKERIILPDSCLRVHLKKLTEVSEEVGHHKDEIGRIALLLLDFVYETPFCLFPESSALASVLASCSLLNVPLSPLTVPKQVKEIQDYLISSAQDIATQ